MAIKQLTVFVPNRKGAVIPLTDILAKNEINIRALSMAETGEFGILRLIVDNTELATKILEENGYLIKTIDVVGVKLRDNPSALTFALDVIGKADINIEYLYAFMARTEKHSYVVIRVEDNDAAEAAIENAGLHLITKADICKL